MALKTDYKDDSYEGKRKYLLIENGDGTYSLDDVTDYKVIGDFFTGYDMNATNKAVNKAADTIVVLEGDVEKIKSVKHAVFLPSMWSESAPYTQTVSVPGIKESDNPVISLHIGPGTTPAAAKSQSEAYGYVDRGETGDGTLTLYCYNLKPASDFEVSVKGV